MISLGPFVLEDAHDSGAMGIIWKGVHKSQRIPIAAKALTSESWRSASAAQGFRQEAQAAARLSHPHIVMVFDYGTLPPEAEARSGGALIAGSPYIIMEFASGGTLKHNAAGMDWGETCHMTMAMLDALAHAHARGIIHRDIKPANILLGTDTDPRPGWKLSDFGIAHAADLHRPFRRDATASDTRERPTGTPLYMAPEQFRGRWRDYGPWTDLYSLGIVVWELVCGEPPYDGEDFIDLAFRHIQEDLPPFRPRVEVPEGLEAWLQRLLAKHHTVRFQRAADAAGALLKIGGDKKPGRRARPRRSATLNFAETQEAGDAPTIAMAKSVDVNETAISSGSLWLPGRIRFPSSWRREAHTVPLNLQGAGQGLFGLRTIPMVDRDSQRDLLWKILEEVCETGVSQLVVLRGQAGLGKSRLARWLHERAHELGLVHALTALHDHSPGRWEGLSGMMMRHFDCAGLDRPRAFARIERLLSRFGDADEYECSALLELMMAGDDDAESPNFRRVRFGSPTERHVVVHRHLERLGRSRGVILRMDDVQWGADALAFAHFVIERRWQLPAPVLMLVSLQDELLDERPLERQRLSDLMELEGVSEVALEALTSGDSKALIQGLLGVSAEMADTVEARSQGNPLFALQLVGDWIQRGVLEMGQEGFTLKEGEQAPLPDDLHALWQGRLERHLEAHGERALQALECAALLGVEVHRRELEAVCERVSLEVPSALVEALVRSNMALSIETGWAFAHGMLRESLERRATEAGRHRSHHLACAQALETLYGAHRHTAARRAHHLLQGGALAQALAPLLDAARFHTMTSDYPQALDLLDARDRALDTLGMGEPQALWVAGAALRAEILGVQWKLEDAASWAVRAAVTPPDGVLHRGRGEALCVLAHISRQRGDRDKAMACAQEAQALHEALGDAQGAATALLSQAITTREQGDAPGAVPLYREARTIFAQEGDELRAAQCLYGLGNVFRQLQDHAAAREHYERAMVIFRRVGNRTALADCVNGLAEIARYKGELAEAEYGYRNAWSLLKDVGSRKADIVRLNLSLVLIYSGHYDKARREVEQVLEHSGQPAFEAIASVCLLPCFASRRNSAAWDKARAQAEALLEKTRVLDPDLAHLCVLSGELMEAASDNDRARVSYEMARGQWVGLGNDEGLAEVEALIEALG